MIVNARCNRGSGESSGESGSQQYANVEAMDNIVSEFIVRTCRMFPKCNTNTFDSIHFESSIRLATYTIFCGSCAEFFIEPLNSCIDDVDYFSMIPGFIAFTEDKPVVPYDIRHGDYPIICFLMEPYPDYPAFIRLHLLGIMRYNWERKIFDFFPKITVGPTILITDQIHILCQTNESEDKTCKVGPAMRSIESPLDDVPPSRNRITGSLSMDMVQSIWCPEWPKEANKWPFRRRNHGWPTTAVIHEVVQNGCHVVMAKHPACRNDVHQCRLSFSVAEVILLQSWTKVQQIVYHLLRFFAKKELINKDCPKEDEVLCTYHFKTLMLWSCEDMSSEWWNSSSVIKICCNLFEKLSKWLKETRCQHYFIPQANLFHEHLNRKIVDEIAEQLIHYCDSDILSLWFVDHYMHPKFHDVFYGKCATDVSSYVHEEILRTCEAMKAYTPYAIDFYVSQRICGDVEEAGKKIKVIVTTDASKYCLRASSSLKGEFNCRSCAEIESSYWFYGSMLRILRAVHLLDCKEILWDNDCFVDAIRQVLIKPHYFRSKHHNLPRPLNTGDNRSQLYLIKAQDLMENLTASTDDLQFEVLSEMSKGLLRKGLECQDSKTNVTAKATCSYMAAFHFVAREYDTVIDLCLRVIMNETPEKENIETLNAGCLLYSEDIFKIVGFYLIFRKTRD